MNPQSGLVTYRMDVVGQEGRFDATKDGVQNHTNRKKEARCSSGHPSQRGDDSRAAGQQHGRDQDVRHETKNDEDHVRVHAVSCSDYLKECVGVRGFALQLDCQGSKQEDLHRRP